MNSTRRNSSAVAPAVSKLLEAGETSEASGTCKNASASLDGVVRDVELESLMYGGEGGRTARRRDLAKQAEAAMKNLEDAIDRAVPDLDSYLDKGATEKLKRDAARQSETGDAADQLASKFGKGPDGTPRDPDAARELQESRARMDRAAKSLREGKVVDASRAQSDALDDLRRLRQRLEESQSQSESSSGGEGGDGKSNDRVEIPGPGQSPRGLDVRRRLVDGMKTQSPRGYEDAAERYYKDLLR